MWDKDNTNRWQIASFEPQYDDNEIINYNLVCDSSIFDDIELNINDFQELVKIGNAKLQSGNKKKGGIIKMVTVFDIYQGLINLNNHKAGKLLSPLAFKVNDLKTYDTNYKDDISFYKWLKNPINFYNRLSFENIKHKKNDNIFYLRKFTDDYYDYVLNNDDLETTLSECFRDTSNIDSINIIDFLQYSIEVIDPNEAMRFIEEHNDKLNIKDKASKDFKAYIIQYENNSVDVSLTKLFRTILRGEKND